VKETDTSADIDAARANNQEHFAVLVATSVVVDVVFSTLVDVDVARSVTVTEG
jgi:hypothetical protein